MPGRCSAPADTSPGCAGTPSWPGGWPNADRRYRAAAAIRTRCGGPPTTASTWATGSAVTARRRSAPSARTPRRPGRSASPTARRSPCGTWPVTPRPASTSRRPCWPRAGPERSRSRRISRCSGPSFCSWRGNQMQPSRCWSGSVTGSGSANRSPRPGSRSARPCSTCIAASSRRPGGPCMARSAPPRRPAPSTTPPTGRPRSAGWPGKRAAGPTPSGTWASPCGCGTPAAGPP